MARTAIQIKAAKLIAQLDKEQERKSAYGPKAVKMLATARRILSEAPEFKAGFIKSTVETISRMGSANSRGAEHWGTKPGLPLVAFDLFRELLRRPLPLTQADFAVMFQQLSDIALLDCEFVRFEPLVAEAEKMASVSPLESRLRKALARLADTLLGRNLRPAARRLHRKLEWGSSAADCKLAGRIERILIQPLQLG